MYMIRNISDHKAVVWYDGEPGLFIVEEGQELIELDASYEEFNEALAADFANPEGEIGEVYLEDEPDERLNDDTEEAAAQIAAAGSRERIRGVRRKVGSRGLTESTVLVPGRRRDEAGEPLETGSSLRRATVREIPPPKDPLQRLGEELQRTSQAAGRGPQQSLRLADVLGAIEKISSEENHSG